MSLRNAGRHVEDARQLERCAMDWSGVQGAEWHFRFYTEYSLEKWARAVTSLLFALTGCEAQPVTLSDAYARMPAKNRYSELLRHASGEVAKMSADALAEATKHIRFVKPEEL